MSNLGPGEALGINDFGEGLSPRATCAFTSLRAATLSAEAAALPAISLGIKLDPFTPGDISYLLWLIMGYLLV